MEPMSVSLTDDANGWRFPNADVSGSAPVHWNTPCPDCGEVVRIAVDEYGSMCLIEPGEGEIELHECEES